jgi:hypothetical protein
MKISLRESKFFTYSIKNNLINFKNVKFFHTYDKNVKNQESSFRLKFQAISMKNFFFNSKKTPEYTLQNIERSENDKQYVKIDETIKFSNGKFVVLETEAKYKTSIEQLLNYVIFPFRVLSWSGIIWFLYNYHVVPLIMSSLTCLFFEKLRKGVLNNKSYVIDKIVVENNGTHCEIHTLKSHFRVDILKIRTLQIEEGIYLNSKLKDMHNNYAPIVVNNTLYLIPKICEIFNQNILNSLREGKYLKFNSIIEEKDAIDEDGSQQDNKSKYNSDVNDKTTKKEKNKRR